MHDSVLPDVLTLLAVSVLTVLVLHRFRLPPIVSYLVVGVVTGPYALGWLDYSATTRFLGEIGVVFLLFTIGLELPVNQLKAMRGPLLGLGGTQVLLGTLSGAIIAWGIGFRWQGALIVGGALAMSSTAIVTKQLADQLELHARHGRLSLGVLLFQDLAAVPFIVLIPILAAGGAGGGLGWPVTLALVKAAGALALFLIAGRWMLRPIFHEVASSRSAELFTLSALLLALGAAWVTSLLGLSLAYGAFLAGMMLAETEFRHQIETDIRPFRDVLLGLFFVTVGMQLDPGRLPAIWGWVLLLVLGVMAGKGILVALLARLTGESLKVSARTGIVLGHGGEFGIALLTLAVGAGLISTRNDQAVLAAIILVAALGSVLIRFNARIVERFFGRVAHPDSRERAIAEAVSGVDDHVILCGFGRIGRNIARFLSHEGIPYVALDNDADSVKEGWESGEPVYFGDAGHRQNLHAAGLDRARALVLTFADEHVALRIVRAARAERQELPILVRARDDAVLERLLEGGATDGVPETLEASMMLAMQLLLLLGLPADLVFERMDSVRSGRYQLLRGFFTGISRGGEHLRSVLLPAGAFAAGRTLGELDLGADGVSVTALRRRGLRTAAGSETVLEAGDVLILQGTGGQLDRAENRLLRG